MYSLCSLTCAANDVDVVLVQAAHERVVELESDAADNAIVVSGLQLTLSGNVACTVYVHEHTHTRMYRVCA